MTAAEAFYRFWGQFGIPVSEEGAAPDTDPPGYPLLVCRYGEGTGSGEAVGLTVSLWARSAGWAQVQELADRIAAARDAFFLDLPGGIAADLPVHFAGRVAQPPYRRGSFARRLREAVEARKPSMRPALVGGDGRDIYDGGALVATGDGRVRAGPRFEEGLFFAETDG